MLITPRSEWQAMPPTYVRALSTTHNGWFWHWLGNAFPAQASDEQILRSIQRYHMSTKGWSDVAYSFAVGRSAKAYELRGWDVAGGHTRGYNYNNSSMAIVFLIGEGELPSPAMFRTAYAIMAMRPEITQLRSHRDVGPTSCPGDAIAAEVNNPLSKEQAMTPTQADVIVERTYRVVLGRPGDAEGVKYWSDRLVNGLSVTDMRWAFLEVRLAADDARMKVLSEMVPASGGPTPEVLAGQAYRMFLDDLVALQA